LDKLTAQEVNMRIARFLLKLGVVGMAGAGIIALVLLARPAPARGAQATGATYVGIEACAACHEDVVQAFEHSIHGQKGFDLRSDKACETCHGPGSAHVDSEGDPTKITRIPLLSPEKQSAVCLTCHEHDAQMFWQGGTHETRGLACETCHSIHKPKEEPYQLKDAREYDLCFTCHKRQKGQFFLASHHPMREGKITCSDCHNPHGTLTDYQISANSIPEKCYQCHAEKRGPFLWEHPPVREDCALCHDPHGSNHIKLLKAKLPFLCQRCHSGTRHPGTLYDQTQIFSNRIFSRSCTNCHAAIHGSNHPSGRAFFR
jgi:DmsE family decaheme c-type cytochrome